MIIRKCIFRFQITSYCDIESPSAKHALHVHAYGRARRPSARSGRLVLLGAPVGCDHDNHTVIGVLDARARTSLLCCVTAVWCCQVRSLSHLDLRGNHHHWSRIPVSLPGCTMTIIILAANRVVNQ